MEEFQCVAQETENIFVTIHGHTCLGVGQKRYYICKSHSPTYLLTLCKARPLTARVIF